MTRKLSVIIPTYRRPTALRLVLRSFLSQHREALALLPTELIVVEGAAIPGTASVIDEARDLCSDLPVDLKHHRTDAFGYIAKVMQGLNFATGDYVLTLTDEDFSLCDYLTPIFANRNTNAVYPVPFTGSAIVRKVYSDGHPSYYRHGVPAFPHFVCSREVFSRLVNDVREYRHYVTDHHIPLLCWELGLNVIFVAEFLRFAPLLHMDSEQEGGMPPGPPPDFSAISRADRDLFRQNWPLARKRAAVEKMTDALIAAAAGRLPGARVAVSGDEYFLALPQEGGANSIAPYYSWIKPPLTREQLSALWTEDRLSSPRWSVQADRDRGIAASARGTLRARVARRLRSLVGTQPQSLNP